MIKKHSTSSHLIIKALEWIRMLSLIIYGVFFISGSLSNGTLIKSPDFHYDFRGAAIPPKSLMDGILETYDQLGTKSNFQGQLNVIEVTNPSEYTMVKGNPLVHQSNALKFFQNRIKGCHQVLSSAKLIPSQNEKEIIVEIQGQVTNTPYSFNRLKPIQMNHLARFHCTKGVVGHIISKINIVHQNQYETHKSNMNGEELSKHLIGL
ncbi:hypothetical protein DFH28DRAFT_204259 [Melampsora americana]|nr:hypothetical protein DFH28DRAFT_204259 [Melampsora americana]